jgi:hypothetical protein
MTDPVRFRFGPLERRGVLAGLRPGQLAILAVAGLLLVVVGRSVSGPAAGPMLASAIVAAIGCFVPIGGRTADEWTPIVLRWGARGFTGRRFISSQPLIGSGPDGKEKPPELPPTLRGLTILAHPVSGSDATIGVIKDRRAGTYTAMLSVLGRSFALLDASEKQRRLSNWAAILAGFAREGGVVRRLQWIERTVPDLGDEIGTYLKDNISVPLDSLIARSYLEVVDDAGPVTQQHETYVALQVDAARCARAIKAAGGRDQGACEVLRRELVALATRLVTSEISVQGALTPRLVARTLRTAFDPACRNTVNQFGVREPERDGVSPNNAGPMSSDETWRAYRSDGAWHRTYWIAEWPRIDADPDFLAPLLLRTERMRTVSLTMEPVSPLKAIRAVESARTSAAADEELRHRAGFVTTARRSREHESLAAHEDDLTHGHALYRFSGFVTVTASNEAELDEACSEIEEAAGRSLLDLRSLNGQQGDAFTFTLPLCRGLA